MSDSISLRMATPEDAPALAATIVAAFEQYRGIEVGHVFYLGKKYAEKLGATFLDAHGQEQVMEMGTYGIGVSRTMAAAVEAHNDENGIRWPISIAPFEVVIIVANGAEEREVTCPLRSLTSFVTVPVETIPRLRPSWRPNGTSSVTLTLSMS